MAEAAATTAKPKGIQRLQIGVNVLLQLILVIFLIGALNWIGFRHFKRWDFSRDHKYELSDKTKRVLNTLKGKMRITVFFLPDAPATKIIGSDVQNLLKE